MASAPAEHSTDRRFLESDMTEPVEFDLARGRVVVLSVRCPDKEGANEDAAVALSLGSGRGVLAVADGVGGHTAGGRASAAAIDAVCKSVKASTSEDGALRNGILDGFERGNRRILELGVGAATTLAVAEIDGHSVRAYHVGDSVLLLVGQRGRIKHQSTPHSPVGMAVEAGFLDEDEAMHHEERHVVSNAMGSAEMHIEIGPRLTMSARDTLVIASDGLFDNLTLDEIIAAIRCGPLLDAVRKLGQLARRRMTQPDTGRPSKPDDLTFVAWRQGSPA